MHFIIHPVNFNGQGAKKAVELLQEKVSQFFYAFDEFEPPMLVNIPGLEGIVGFTYVPCQRPPGIFCGKPYLEINADNIKVRKLTDTPPTTRNKFTDSVQRVQLEFPGVFVIPESYAFGPKTPTKVHMKLLKQPDLIEAINRIISDKFGGMPVDENGEYDAGLHLRIQSVVNDPMDNPPGLLTFEEYESIVEQGRL